MPAARTLKRAHAGAALAVCALKVSACTNILSLDVDFASAAETLCKCDAFTDEENAFWPDVVGTEGCKAYVQSALERDAEQAVAWLNLYRDAECGACENANACLSAAPLCIPTGSACAGDSNASDASCCGYDPENVTQSYCGPNNVCATNTPGCRAAFESCESDLDCCGGDGGLAGCIPETDAPDSPTRCLQVCELDDPVQCPTCCARIKPKEPGPEFGVCLEFDNALIACDSLCMDGGGCAEDQVCAPVEYPEFYVYRCKTLTPTP